MLLAELPTYTARIDVPYDVIEHGTGRDDRVSVTIEVAVPIDARRDLPIAASFGGAWPVSRMVYGPTGRYDAIDVDYLRAGNDFFAPSHILNERHLNEVSVAFGPGGLRLASYRAFQDWEKLVGARDLNLDWEQPHRSSRRTIRYTPDKAPSVSIDAAFRERYAFDEAFANRIRRTIRENFVMRPGGIWMRMPLPVWRIHDKAIGLDPFPRGQDAQTSSFALDRLDDLERQVRATVGRQAEAAIAGRAATIHHLDPDILNGHRDDLAVLSRSDIVQATHSLAPLLPVLDRSTVATWHSLLKRPGPAAAEGRADTARAFIEVVRGVQAAEPSEEREAWLNRTSVLAYRLEQIELPRLAADTATLPSPRAA